MRASYWIGAGLAVVLCAAVSVGVLKNHDSDSQRALVFDPPFVGASEPWILPGASRQLTVQLRNLSTDDASVEELRFSCPCAKGTIAGTERLPVQIPAEESVPVNIVVTSQKGERGPVELKFGVVGRIGDQPVEAGGSAAIRFVQHLNAEPSLLALGKINEVEGECTETVNLWFPAECEPPTELTVEPDDPCVTARIEQFPKPRSSDEGQSRRMMFARLAVTVDPTIAPDRMKAYLLVRSGVNELRIPVLGLIERSSAEENPL